MSFQLRQHRVQLPAAFANDNTLLVPREGVAQACIVAPYSRDITINDEEGDPGASLRVTAGDYYVVPRFGLPYVVPPANVIGVREHYVSLHTFAKRSEAPDQPKAIAELGKMWGSIEVVTLARLQPAFMVGTVLPGDPETNDAWLVTNNDKLRLVPGWTVIRELTGDARLIPREQLVDEFVGVTSSALAKVF